MKKYYKKQCYKKITDPTPRCQTSSNMSVFCVFVYVTSIKVKASWCKFFSFFRLNFKFQCRLGLENQKIQHFSNQNKNKKNANRFKPQGP